MEELFQKLISVNTDILMLTLLTFFFTLEQIISRASLSPKRTPHLLHGIPLLAGYMMINFGLAFMVVFCVQWIVENQIGLFNQIQIPYAFNRGYHTFSILWRLHRVHHSDTTMDSSTFLRFHPLDWFLDNSSVLVACFIFGLDLKLLFSILYCTFLCL